MLRIHLLQNWFALSDPVMIEAPYEITSLHPFVRLTRSAPIPGDTTIKNFRHPLDRRHDPATYSIDFEYRNICIVHLRFCEQKTPEDCSQAFMA